METIAGRLPSLQLKEAGPGWTRLESAGVWSLLFSSAGAGWSLEPAEVAGHASCRQLLKSLEHPAGE